MAFKQWLRSIWAQRETPSSRTRADAARATWLEQEEERQLQEVRERLERVEYQLETTTLRAGRRQPP